MSINDIYNREQPMIMHVDLNSAFATVEQQARPMLRGRPVAVLNRRTEHTIIVTASYEAKAHGVKVGMSFLEAKRLVPDIIAVESDPAKYRFVYRKLLAILGDYSPNAIMKSIDEGLIDFHGMRLDKPLVDIGYEIKQRLKDEIGCAMRCNIGIGPSRFLAKTAAGLHKPDGLDVIDAGNLRATYETMKLTDLTGIASHMEQRLNAVGIYTPIEFLDADMVSLQKIVFKSIIGRDWYARLRGYEVDDRTFDVKTVGRQYVLESRNLTRIQIVKRLHNLCESVGSRLRSQNKVARGVYVHARTAEHLPDLHVVRPPSGLVGRDSESVFSGGGISKDTSTTEKLILGTGGNPDVDSTTRRSGNLWHACRTLQAPFYSDAAINTLAQQLFLNAPDGVREIGVRCYNLSNDDDKQMSLFGDMLAREQQLVSAIDMINQRYGDRTVHSADTLDSGEVIKPKVPFGSTRYL